MAQSETVPGTSHHTDTWVAGASGELRALQVWEAELCRQASTAQGDQSLQLLKAMGTQKGKKEKNLLSFFSLY